jgi:hypothetical protein
MFDFFVLFLLFPFPSLLLDAVCSGHGETEVMSFADFQGQGESYTNREFYDFAHPWSETLPYTYDTFGFEYCADKGKSQWN